MKVSELPLPLQQILDPDSEHDLAVIVSTIDETGYPHFSLLSTFEVFRVGESLYGSLYGNSRAATNLSRREQGALAFLQPSGICYLKFLASPVLDRERSRTFRLDLVSFKIDHPADEESGAGLVSALQFRETPSSRERRRARREACLASLR